MADKYPLILDTTDNKIKELPSGDNLKLAGSSIVDVENIVATGTIQVDTLVVTTLQASGSNLSTVATTGNFNDLINVPNIFDGDYNNLNNKPTLFSGDFNDLANKPVIATNISQLVNDTGFITNNTAALTANNFIDLAQVARSNDYNDLDNLPNLNDYLRADAVVDGTLTVDVNNTGNLAGNVLGIDGTTLLVDADNNAIIGTLISGLNSGVNIDGNGEDVNISTSSIISLNADTILLNGEVAANIKGSIDGDLRGSVFGDDSTLLLDGINKTVNASVNGNIIYTGQALTVSSVGRIIIQSNNGLPINISSANKFEVQSVDFEVTATGATTIDSTGQISLIASSGKLYLETGQPATSRGQFGDKAGMFAVDQNGIMYCVEDYTNGSVDIWRKIKWNETFGWDRNSAETDGIYFNISQLSQSGGANQIRFNIDSILSQPSAITSVAPSVDVGYDSLNANSNVTFNVNIGEGSRTYFDPQQGSNVARDATITNLRGQVRLIADVPTTARGSSGDKEGAVAVDSNYMYYCIADYTTGSVPIWVRTAWGDTSDWS